MITPRSSAMLTRAAAGFLALLLVVAAAPSTAVAEEAKPDDVARILAGLEPAAGSPLAPLTREPAWQSHARSFNAAWASIEQRQLSRIRAWSAANLTSPAPVVFYMFSGPDYLYVDAFFPNRATYVLSGLEPVGPIPTIGGRQSLQGLPALRASLSTVLSYSFFITKKMRSTLAASNFRGTLPVIYVFLARSGKTLQEVSLVSIDKDGNVVPAAQDPQSNANGAKIVFSGADGKPQTLYYFRTDISDHGLKNSAFLKFTEQLGKGESFIKSASYLLHSDSFSKIREFLLTHSTALVQDDSGVPIRFFKPDEWQLRPFGRYLGPIGEFPGRHQRGLDELFRKANAPRIDFGVGYRWRPNESNLLLAIRKAQ
jgi:hypothetical protein